MTRLEKIKLAIEKGYTCNPKTGEVFGPFGKLLKSKSNNGYTYFSLCENKKRYNLFAHQFIWYVVNNSIVECLDHIDRNKSNNKISNLRSVTQQQNAQNKNTKGIYMGRKNKWYSRIYFNGKTKHLGVYKTEQEARQAYIDAKKIYHVI